MTGTAQREPRRDHYDADIQLTADEEGRAIASALVKLSFGFTERGIEPAPAVPLLHDFRDAATKPRLHSASDYLPLKLATDVVFRGSAYAPGGRATPNMTVRARVGSSERRVCVFGPRQVRWSQGGHVTFSEPEPFESIPMTFEEAYGGLDARVPPPDGEAEDLDLLLQVDHPGLYPRNACGRGYVVAERPVEDLWLPALEDPEQRLTPESLVVGDPALWYRQPSPACLDWVPSNSYPRLFFARITPWFPPPQDASLPEVRRQELPPQFLDALRGEDEAGADEPFDPRFFQGASRGMRFEAPLSGAPIVVEGMHPERPKQSFQLPERPPEIVFDLDGAATRPRSLRLHTVEVCPERSGFTMLWRAESEPLPRVFLPGIHQRIPVAIGVNGDELTWYETPPRRLAQHAAPAAGAPAR